MSADNDNAYARALEMSGAQLAQVMPLVGLAGGVMIFKDYSMSVGFSVKPPICGMIGDDSRALIYEGLRTALRTLPSGANGQVYFSQQSRTAHLERIKDPGRASAPLARQAIAVRGDAFLRGVEGKRLRECTVDVYVNLPSTLSPEEIRSRTDRLNRRVHQAGRRDRSGILAPLFSAFDAVELGLQSIFNPLGGAVLLTIEEYKSHRAALMSAAESLNASLAQAGLDPRALTGDDILRRLYRKNNPRKYDGGLNPRPYNPDGGIPVAEYFLNSAFDWDPAGKRVEKGFFFLDGMYGQVLTLRMPPDPLDFPHFENVGLFGGLQQMDMVVNFTATSDKRRIRDLEAEQKAIQANEKGQTAKNKLDQINTELVELGAGEERLWQAQHLFVIRHEDLTQLKRISVNLISMAQRAKSAEITEEVHAVRRYFLASQPGWARDMDLNRHNIFNTRQLVAALPVFSGSAVAPEARLGALFETADGSLLNIFPHDAAEYSVSNLLICGGSNSGKSVLTNTMVSQLARHDPRIAIVDIGSSYKRTVDSMGGTFLEYDLRSAECRINPFDVFAGRSADQEELQCVLLLLEKMVAERSRPELLRGERGALEDALRTLIQKHNGKVFYLSDLRETLQGFSNNRDAHEVASRLLPFVTGGTYAKLFDGPTRVPTDGRVNCFELARLRHSAPELLPVVFQSVVQHVVHMANEYPDDLKFLFMDEAHVLLEDPILRKFVELAFRTFRKLRVSVFGISQGISDWIIEGNEQAIIGNIGGILACAQKVASVDVLAKLYELSPNERQALLDLQVIPGVVSEFVALRFTSKGRKATVCANRMSPIEYAMFTTSPDDTAVINRWTQSPWSLTLSQAVQKFAEKYPRGVVMAGGPAAEDRPVAAA